MKKPKRKKEKTARKQTARKTAFTDGKDRIWTVVVDGGVMMRLKSDCEFDICKLVEQGEPTSLISVLEDLERTINCLWVCCEKQAIQMGVDEYSFAEGLFGDVIEDAVRCMTTAIVNFFPNSSQREMMTKMFNLAWKAGNQLLEEQAEKVIQMIDATQTKFSDSSLSGLPLQASKPEPIPTAK